MLRESATAQNLALEVTAVVRDDADPMIPLGRELRAFADAIALLDTDELEIARSELVAAGGLELTTEAAAICGYFAAMNRLLDATGVPVKDVFDMSEALAMTVPTHLRPRG